MNREDILERLDKMDMEAFATIDDSNIYRLIIVGGSGLVLLGTISRATQDIDALDASPAIRHLLEKYDANLRVSTYINNFPYNYEDRLQRLPVGGRKIEFYTASLEDIVIAKLYSFRDLDRQDLISDEVLNNIDWERLKHLALDEDEAKSSALNEQSYKNFLYDYYEYVRMYGPHEETDV
jgi:hypothetical protein